VRPPSDDDILEAAILRIEDHPSARAWIAGPLRGYLASLGQTGPILPSGLARALNHPDGEPVGRLTWLRLAAHLAETVAGLGSLSPRRAGRIGVEAVMARADRAYLRERDRLALRPGEAEAIRRAEALTSWRTDGRRVFATFHLGRLSFTAKFEPIGPGRWERHWLPDAGTGRILTLSGAGPGERSPVATGLFPAIDAALRDLTRAFLDRYEPEMLMVAGFDGRRNGHNARTYGSIAPEAYALVPRRAEGHPRADADGTVAVEFRRLPEAAPSHPVPFEEGITYGYGGVPLPCPLEARGAATAIPVR